MLVDLYVGVPNLVVSPNAIFATPLLLAVSVMYPVLEANTSTVAASPGFNPVTVTGILPNLPRPRITSPDELVARYVKAGFQLSIEKTKPSLVRLTALSTGSWPAYRVAVAVGVGECDGVAVAVGEGDGDGVAVAVGVAKGEGVGVAVAVGVGEGVAVAVGVGVTVGVGEGVGVGVAVSLAVGAGAGAATTTGNT